MRWLVRLAVLAVVVLAVLIVGQVVVKPAVERQVADKVQEVYGLAERPDVDIHGFPFVVDALRGTLDGATVDAGPVTVEGLTVDEAHFELDGIHFSALDMVLDREEARADTVVGRIEVEETALNTYLLSRGLQVDVDLTPQGIAVSGTVTVGDQQVSGQARGAVRVEGSVLRFTATEVQAEGIDLDDASRPAVAQQLTFDVPVPAVVGVTVTGIAVGDGHATLTAAARNYDLIGGAR